MTPDEPLPLAIANPAVALVRDVTALTDTWRARGRTARGVLVLAYVAPITVRKPTHNGNPPDGYTRAMIVRHLLPELDGVWWIPDSIVAHVARFTGVS